MGIFNSKEQMNYYGQKNNLSAISDEELKSLHAFLVGMLGDIVKVCEKYKLVYFLGGGSCLGAIRHQGFIPWDDDLDINMPRRDYEKFKRVFEKELGDKYILNAPNYSDEVIARFPKILAKNTLYSTSGFGTKKEFEKIFIDIFIMENVPENKAEYYLKGFCVNFMEFVAGQVLIYDSGKKNPEGMKAIMGEKNFRVRSIIGHVFSFLSYTKWCSMIDKVVRGPKYPTKKVCFPTGRKHYFGEVMSRKIMLPPQKVKFEGTFASVPAHYKKYLSNLYGSDYMQLPPEEKREKHFVSALDFDYHE